jgi:hypothetical protein
VEGRLLLNIVVRQSAAVLELLASKDQALLVRRDTIIQVRTLCNIQTEYKRTPPCPESWP